MKNTPACRRNVSIFIQGVPAENVVIICRPAGVVPVMVKSYPVKPENGLMMPLLRARGSAKGTAMFSVCFLVLKLVWVKHVIVFFAVNDIVSIFVKMALGI